MVVTFSGGSGRAQGKSLGADGREKDRSFVKDGGGYPGICAGASLASADCDWLLHIVDAKVLDRKHWTRGFGDVELKVTTNGRDIFLCRRTERPYIAIRDQCWVGRIFGDSRSMKESSFDLPMDPG